MSVFFCALFSNYQSDIQIHDNPETSTLAEHLLLLEYVQNNFRSVTLASVADYFHYNKTYLSRLFTKLTGKSFVKIITELKLAAGMELINEPELTLDQIAEYIGYDNGDYFSKVFKKRVFTP